MNWEKYRIPLVEGRYGRPVYRLAAALGLLVFVIISVSGLQAMKSAPQAADLDASAPPELVNSPPPAFASIVDITERKAAFFDYLRPIVRYENDRILRDRKRLLLLYGKHVEGSRLSAEDKEWLGQLGKYYFVFSEFKEDNTWLRLLRRVDVVPEDLALVQAAVESQWGTSRFALEGNSFFGQWCFRKDCGSVPRKRAPGKTHEVESFGSVRGSVRSYLNNLNTHPAYRDFRSRRYVLRQQTKPLDANTLVPGLVQYSERRDEYVRQIRIMIEQNRTLLEG